MGEILNENITDKCALPLVVMLQLMERTLPGVSGTAIVDLFLEQ